MALVLTSRRRRCVVVCIRIRAHVTLHNGLSTGNLTPYGHGITMTVTEGPARRRVIMHMI